MGDTPRAVKLSDLRTADRVRITNPDGTCIVWGVVTHKKESYVEIGDRLGFMEEQIKSWAVELLDRPAPRPKPGDMLTADHELVDGMVIRAEHPYWEGARVRERVGGVWVSAAQVSTPQTDDRLRRATANSGVSYRVIFVPGAES